jgi:flagellar biosynthetic protein FliR
VDIAFVGIAKLEVLLLVFVRTAGIFTIAPIFGSHQVPMQVRVAISLGLALVFVPLCLGSAGAAPLAPDVFTMAMLVVKEAMVGLLIGFVTILVFFAIQAAGEFIDVQSGFAFASQVDPTFGSQAGVCGRFHNILAGLLFFVTNAHFILLSGLSDSFRAVPVGAFEMNPAIVGGTLDIFTGLFAVALRIAAPVIAAVFLADVAMALVARAVPQMNILMVGMPLKLGVGLVGMMIALPVAVALSRNTLGDLSVYTNSLLRLLVAS